MNNVEFVKNTVVRVLIRMEKEIEKGNNQECKTLTDSMKESLEIIRDDISKDGNNLFVVLLERELERICTEIAVVANKSIVNDDLREHRNWLITYRKLNEIKKSLSLHLRIKSKSQKNLSQYKESKEISLTDFRNVASLLSKKLNLAVEDINKMSMIDIARKIEI